MKCSRTACQVELDGSHFAIWNLGTDQPRLYCVQCGKSIIGANQTFDEIKLKYEFCSMTPPVGE